MSTSPEATPACMGDHCITCADEGVPMTIMGIDDQRRLALCTDVSGARHAVETALLETVTIGQVVLVHAGVAIAALGGEMAA
jgi:hydrogenase maturation factor